MVVNLELSIVLRNLRIYPVGKRMMDMNILVSQVSYFASIGIIKLLRQLRRDDIHILGTSYLPTGMTSGSVLVEQCFQSPMIADAGPYIDFIETLCIQKHIDVLFVSDDDELLLLKHSLRLNCILVCADVETLCLFMDKKQASVAINGLGIAVPPIIHDLCSERPASGKIIFRKTHAKGSQGIYTVDLNATPYIENHFTPANFIQEFIEGNEYTVDIFCDRDGEMKLAIPRRRIDIRNGITYKCVIEYIPQIIDACKVIYNRYQMPGFSNVQFILRDNEAFFVELNPRFAGTGIASSLASFNICSLYLAHFYEGEKLGTFQEYMKYVAWDSIITRYYEETVFQGA
jgi:carbamoyl-phosphate synthase large subunit